MNFDVTYKLEDFKSASTLVTMTLTTNAMDVRCALEKTDKDVEQFLRPDTKYSLVSVGPSK